MEDYRNYLMLLACIRTDRTVAAADYIVWRKGMGSEYTPDHYDQWRANFGRTAAGAAAVGVNAKSAHVPEPTSVVLLALALAGWYTRATQRVKSGGPE